MSYHCPHCQKLSQTPDGLTLAGFDIICGYCAGRFAVPDEPPRRGEESHYAIACPNCDTHMRLSETEYDILRDHAIYCPKCTLSLKLPPLRPHQTLPPSQPTLSDKNTPFLVKYLFVFFLFTSGLALVFTSYGQEVISQLSQKLAQWRTPLWHIKTQWHEFIAFLQGFFL